MWIVERPERAIFLSLQRGDNTAAYPEPFDALAHDVLEPAIAHRAPGTVFLADEIDQKRRHLVTLVAVANHGDPDAQIELLQPAFSAGDGDAEIVRRPCL